ncbi:sigma-70 family RNA polymerase sigma factor [Tropicimonas sp. TH_r6]|uniref:sigma-70 family RNA polymerase sigma factor n=1 Tax=Tropicimonas sp. TH_r6 TaxID=3082085 RepID=UPI0029549867|nr:sigma-70 family RNA polymerase sigma factor [Tropicimonas sp. TH_r6]MDV7141229.1 sigma-70 family RNA polymerase sigma factor [Tropicimonas sp. TH_r6]
MTELVTEQVDWAEAVRRVAESGDQAAFAALFGHFAPRVKGFLIRSGLTPAAAEDCAQDVMATLWRKAEMFDPDKASVATWVFTIARNRKIDMFRKQARPEPEDLPWGPEPEPEQAESLGLKQDSARLGAALAELPEAQRKLVEAAYFGDLSHGEIAEKTGIPLGTIKSRLRLALEKLRRTMQ